ncbi:MAG TPA: hypothetical protein VG101_00525 [Puia sp.]|jgi:hypothetical protein|nr:hypothetical protein [Puia sp.]
MKSTLFLLALIIGGAFSGFAQTTDTTSDPGYTASPAKTPVSPPERAARQLNTLQKNLNLNQDQVIKLRMVLLRLNIALDSLRTNPSGDKKSDNQARRAITQDADGKIYAVLTIDQQLAYAKWKQEQQLRRQLNRQANKAPATDTTIRHP